MLKQLVRRALERRGYELIRRPSGDARTTPWDFSDDKRRIFEQVRSYTMTSPERVGTLIDAVHHVVAAGIPGAMVECGVWRGGSMMAVAQTLHDLGETRRDLYLYDTFEGPPPPSEEDAEKDPDHFAPDRRMAPSEIPPALQTLPFDEIDRALLETKYPKERIHYVVGDVQDTIPRTVPNQIAILRLDTDRYSSTRHELEHLYPLVSHGGILIIDDYASFSGARAATDEYFESQGVVPMLHRIDPASRLVVRSG